VTAHEPRVEGFPGNQVSLGELLRQPDGDGKATRLVAWLNEDPALGALARAQYNLAGHHRRDSKVAIRTLRTAVSVADVAEWARVDPALQPLRGLAAFGAALVAADTPRLTDLRPMRPIGVAVRNADIHTPFQFVAVAHDRAARSELSAATGIPVAQLEAAARYADLAVLLRGDTQTLQWLWNVNVRSVCDLARADICEIARGISVDHLRWEAPLQELLTGHQRRALETGPAVRPFLVTCPGPVAKPAPASSTDVRSRAPHCCYWPNHRCRGPDRHTKDRHVVDGSHRCWIESWGSAASEPNTSGPRDGSRPRCAHPRIIEPPPKSPATDPKAKSAESQSPALSGCGCGCGCEGGRADAFDDEVFLV
jgi:hypothetical protein